MRLVKWSSDKQSVGIGHTHHCERSDPKSLVIKINFNIILNINLNIDLNINLNI